MLIIGVDSKLFTITFSINMIMFGFAVSGHWPYATHYAGAFAVANFNVSILMRNEIFGRCLYGFVNTFFAKVSHPRTVAFRPLIVPFSGHLSGSVSGAHLFSR